ncbi:MAG: hypothetical protein WDA60_16610 [Acidimicrobiia bacterium]
MITDARDWGVDAFRRRVWLHLGVLALVVSVLAAAIEWATRRAPRAASGGVGVGVVGDAGVVDG